MKYYDLYEKKQNLWFLNLLIILIFIFSFSFYSLFDIKKDFYEKKNNTLRSKGVLAKSNITNNIYINYKNSNLALNQSYDKDNSTLIKDDLKNILIYLDKNSILNEEEKKNLLIQLNNFQSLNEKFFLLQSILLLKKNTNNLLEIRIKIDDHRFIKINQSKDNPENFLIKKVLFNSKIDSELNLFSEEVFDKNLSFINLINDNPELSEYIGFDNSQLKTDINYQINNSIKNIDNLENKIVLLEKNLNNNENLKSFFNELSFSKENINNLISTIKYKDKKNISFKGLFLIKNNNKESKRINVAYKNNVNDSQSKAKKELIYFSLNNKSYYLFKNKGKNYYYDSSGRSLHTNRMFSIPLSNSYRISSDFGMRFHPVLKYTRMHTGVDLAIKHGSPVKAPANGIVEFAGKRGGYGNYIVINHGNHYKTAYGHLSKFERGMKKGSFVSKNQLIAYVGNTGTSSGPHLHYEMIIKNKFVHPLKNNLNITEKLSNHELKKFKKLIQIIDIYMKNNLENNSIINKNNQNIKSFT